MARSLHHSESEVGFASSAILVVPRGSLVGTCEQTYRFPIPSNALRTEASIEVVKTTMTPFCKLFTLAAFLGLTTPAPAGPTPLPLIADHFLRYDHVEDTKIRCRR